MKKYLEKIFNIFIMVVVICGIGLVFLAIPASEISSLEKQTNNIRLEALEMLTNRKPVTISKKIEPNFKQIRLSIVEISVGRAGGAGVIIKQDKKYLYVLTAKHVLTCKGRIVVQVTAVDGTKRKVIGIDRKNTYESEVIDLGLIKVPRPKGIYKILDIAKTTPEVGKEIYTIGHPHNIHYAVNRGNVVGYAKRRMKKQCGFANYLVINAPAHTGNSGGPAINKYGQIIGIVVGRDYINKIPYPCIVFVTGLEYIENFLEELKL